jgi:hypothetical protein
MYFNLIILQIQVLAASKKQSELTASKQTPVNDNAKYIFL